MTPMMMMMMTGHLTMSPELSAFLMQGERDQAAAACQDDDDDDNGDDDHDHDDDNDDDDDTCESNRWISGGS